MPTPTCATRLASVLVAVLVLASPVATAFPAALLIDVAVAAKKEIAPPSEPGPYNVGTTMFLSAMSGGRLTRIQVYYPTDAAPDCSTLYTVNAPAGPYYLESPYCAVVDAPALPELFPLVVHDHGGVRAGGDFQRIVQLPMHEIMASHGFVVAVALHSGNPVARVRDLPLVIDALLARSAADGDLLTFSIDPARIGISGYSTGGAAAIGAAGGLAALGIAADPRIKAMALYEPSTAGISLADASTIVVPYLVMGGDQQANGLAIPALFDATVLATPRIYVLNPSATHSNYLTGMASEIDQTRDAALLADPLLPEPLTVRTATNAAANRAYDLWNIGENLFADLGFGAGSGRNFCTRVGVDSVFSLDIAPLDGFTDSPPFMATDAYTLRSAIPEEVMVPLIIQYTVSFWKTFLEGDHHYMRYLTPGYAVSNHLEAIVSKVE